ncbi:gliding motility-associated peptidyl-prolyl isomerase GldI [Patiriisocius marinus]|uniref:Peptidyl-prolyl cis-trans isomerase n=1 Tax=Patiriisocius marinus TaxID=1397112 RepID=A0A5J4INK1_9FLAO|nr:gliding motility-associated peptidyl-prolyl isomerase GldI [Patiriisocius marinus]GER58989.1 peptidyl-prolyl cis-trans isomerase [Patiriisocius marinus]
MNKVAALFLMFSMFILGCTTPEARKPVKQNSGSFISASAERNKKLFEEEKEIIEAIIKADSNATYITSESGFWYNYQVKDTTALSQKPSHGDLITFTYNVKDLEGNTILSKEENGLINYRVDLSNQELISGIRDGIKLLEVGETATFLFPSYKAYGYYGIEKKLGTNVPIASTVTLLSITQTEEN